MEPLEIPKTYTEQRFTSLKSLNFFSGIAAAIVVFIIWMGFSKYQFRKETIAEGNIVRVKIERVSCGRRSYILFKDRGAQHSVNLHGSVCGELDYGQVVEVYYSENTGLYLLKNDGLGDDDLPFMWTGILLAAGLVIFYIRSYRRAKRSVATARDSAHRR